MPSSHSLAEPNVASLSCSIRALSAGSTFLPTASMTDDNCSAPMTDVLALGHVKSRRGEYARPLSKYVSSCSNRQPAKDKTYHMP